MTQKPAKTQAQPAEVSANGDGHLSDTPLVDAPWTGTETSSFQRLASRRHGQVKTQLDQEKPKEIGIRRPTNQEHIRVKPCPDGRVPLALIKDERNRNSWYAVDPDIEAELEEYCLEAYVVEVLSSVKSDNGEPDYFLWILPIINHNGSDNDWWQSWREIAARAETEWVQLHAGKKKAYATPPKTSMPDPIWPPIAFEEAFECAMKEHIITTVQHPFAKQLLGGS